METLNEDKDVNRIWGNIKHNIQISAKGSLGMHEWKQHKPWFDEECLGFLDQMKRAKMQWVQDPCQSNVDKFYIHCSVHHCNCLTHRVGYFFK